MNFRYFPVSNLFQLLDDKGFARKNVCIKLCYLFLNTKLFVHYSDPYRTNTPIYLPSGREHISLHIAVFIRFQYICLVSTLFHNISPPLCYFFFKKCYRFCVYEAYTKLTAKMCRESRDRNSRFCIKIQ